MKLVWCPETASKAYMAAIKAMSEAELRPEQTDIAGFVSAMAGGWKASLIVEAWSPGDGAATSLGLISAASQTLGKHVCIVSDQESYNQYVKTMSMSGIDSNTVTDTLIVGSDMGKLHGVEMMVVDFQRRDAGRLLQEARPGPRGMVVVCKNGGLRRGEKAMIRVAGRRVVRSTFLPIGQGVEILHVGVGKGPRLGGRGRWIKHVDEDTGEEHVFRRS